MKLSNNTSSNYFSDENFSNQEIADKELKELAEKLEKDLGHHYFSQPLDYSGDKKENKNTELLELEQEISNLGKIVLPKANLSPEKELPQPETIEEKNKKTSAYLQSFKPYQEIKKNISEKQKKHASFKLTIDEHWLNWKKPLEQKKLSSAQNKKQIPKSSTKENFWSWLKKEKKWDDKQNQFDRESMLLAKKQEQEKNFLEWQNQKKLQKQSRLEKKEQIKEVSPKFNWYLTVIKKPTIYLVGLELLLYLMSTAPLIKNFILNTLLNYLILVDLSVFSWLTFNFKRNIGEKSLTAIKAVALTGLLVGFFRAFFKFFWFNENWTLINIFIEPLIWAFYGIIVSFVLSLIIKRKYKTR